MCLSITSNIWLRNNQKNRNQHHCPEMKVAAMSALSSPSPLQWVHCAFDDMTPRQVHDLLRLRQQIFIIEQECIFPDIDGLDPVCNHVFGLLDDRVVAAARIVAPGLDPDHCEQGEYPAIGRVVASPELRGQGVGRKLMLQAIASCDDSFAGKGIFLNAQLYLKSFYASLGFAPFGEAFYEDGIAHISMLRAA